MSVEIKGASQVTVPNAKDVSLYKITNKEDVRKSVPTLNEATSMLLVDKDNTIYQVNPDVTEAALTVALGAGKTINFSQYATATSA